MNRAIYRRIGVGLASGLGAGWLLAPVGGNAVGGLALGGFFGAVSALVWKPGKGFSPLDRMLTFAALGVPAWGVVNVLALPLLAGHGALWKIEDLRTLFPLFAHWLLFGAALGLLLEGAQALAHRWLGPEPLPPVPAPAAAPTRILILGGGFAGVTAAAHLERQFAGDPTVAITLVSATNALLFTPMLAEVAASSLEPTHISAPLRTSLKRTRVVQGQITAIDLPQRCVRLENGGTPLKYDHLVLTLGAVSNYFGGPGVKQHSLNFKSLTDAIRIRNRVIAAFDRADAEPDPTRRRAHLTFVVAGGGFSGAELAGGLNDFTRGMLADYPALSADDLSVVLVHSRERILPELSDSLAGYALERMRARGVTCKLGVRVADAREDAVMLDNGEEIPARTLIWTAGTAPSPLLKEMPVQRDKRGAVIVEPTLEVMGHPGVWALGDCASVPDAKTGQSCPPTAQYALREAKTLARNVHASLRGKPLRGFHFDNLGTLCVVGHHTACAEIKGLKFSGLFAWLLWRGIYLSKLPGLERKVRVLSDWIIELFFPRDIVQTIDFERMKDEG